MITIISGGKTYKATLTEKDNGYNVNVFLEKEKMPIYGTRFRLRASFENEIMPWIKTKCKNHSEGKKEGLELLEMFKN